MSDKPVKCKLCGRTPFNSEGRIVPIWMHPYTDDCILSAVVITSNMVQQWNALMDDTPAMLSASPFRKAKQS